MTTSVVIDEIKQFLDADDFYRARQFWFRECGNCHPAPKDIVDLFKQYNRPDPEKCPDCGMELPPIFDESSFYWNKRETCPKCWEAAVMADVKARLPQIMQKQGIGKRYLSATLDKFDGKLQKLAKSGESLFLHGGVGVGKTYFMAAIMRQIILTMPADKHKVDPNGYMFYRTGNDPYYPLLIAVPTLLSRIKASFSKGGEPEIIEFCRDIEILFLDDIGVEKSTDWALETVYGLIDHRYSELKQTYITSNLNLNELSKRLDDRITSRIAGMCKVIHMPGKDRRLLEMKK